MSSVYTVRYAPQALDDLRDLYSYVAFSLKEPATAQKLVNRIRKAARSLDALPGRYPVVDWEPWQSMGMHRFTVENFLLFYLIDQSTCTVTLVRIVYGGLMVGGIFKTLQNRPLRKISNFFAINLLTIWVNGDIIQTTNPQT